MPRRLKTRGFKRDQSRSRSLTRRQLRTSTSKKGSATRSRLSSRSKTARKLIDLTKRANKYQANIDQYIELLQHASLWFDRNLEEIWNMICVVNSDEAETITYDSFKASMHLITNYFVDIVLMDVKAPFDDVEVHLLTMILDPNTEGSIQIKKFADGILELCKEEEMKALKTCPSPLIKPITRWVRVHFRNAALASISHHPLHFDEDVPTSYTTDLLVDVIRRRNHICAPSIKLFRKQEPLPPEEIQQVGTSLEQLGIKGGTRLSPMEATILYQTQCSINLPRANLFVTSIDDSYLLWDEAALWLEDVDLKGPGVPSEKSRSTVESVTPTESTISIESDSSSVGSLASFLTVEKKTKRRAKRIRNLARRCEQRMRDLEGARSPLHSTTSSSVLGRPSL
ncbi:conserved hypothetical protein [Echinococcus multilocularis]|uniref:Uncharacterized protein n=1 Tax=Echinococcus multilocularis TaxID=6211 RepID=A0A068Y311_ECHMU|nr:conserved hypothetical protein [Echinococcus multilocularis]